MLSNSFWQALWLCFRKKKISRCVVKARGQASFREGRSIVDHIHTLHTLSNNIHMSMSLFMFC